MVHFPILIVLRRVLEMFGYASWHWSLQLTAFFFAVILVLAVSAVLYYVVERPVRTRLRDQMGVFAPLSGAQCSPHLS
jgi:peptidoglycan/LPS O-acetylase OafA/YrhL